MKTTRTKDGITTKGNLVTIRRGHRTTVISKKDWDQRCEVNPVFVNITSDSKLKMATPEEILFGPAHRDLPPSQEASYNPATGDFPRPPGMRRYF